MTKRYYQQRIVTTVTLAVALVASSCATSSRRVVKSWPNGQPKEVEIAKKGGRREVHYYESGQVEFDAFRDAHGKFHGVVRAYWPSGHLFEGSYWEHGRVLRGKYLGEDGSVQSEIKNGTGWRLGLYNGKEAFVEYYYKGEYQRGGH